MIRHVCLAFFVVVLCVILPVFANAERLQVRPDGLLIREDGIPVRLACLRVFSDDQMPNVLAVITAFLDSPAVEMQDESPKNRYGIRGVRVTRTDTHTDLAETLVSQGLARPDPWDECTHAFWQRLQARDQSPSETLATVEAALDTYTCIRATPVRAVSRAPFLYLQYGDDWRRDFTVRVRLALRRMLEKQYNLDPRAWTGHSLRVCGTVRWRFGAAIDVETVRQVTNVAP